MLLSLLPLAYHLTAPHSWVGYGEGNYAFDDGHINLQVAGITYGGNKPLVQGYIANATATGAANGPAPIVEVSDQASYVDGVSLFSTQFTTRTLNDTTLVTQYTGPNFTVSKTITVLGAGRAVIVAYSSPSPVAYDISFWHWYFLSVDGMTSQDIGGPGCVSEQGEAHEVVADYTTALGSLPPGPGSMNLTAGGPSSLSICRDGTGINKFVMSSTGQALRFTISGSVGTAGDVSPISDALVSISSLLPVQIAFPLTALMVILVWRKKSRSR